MNNEFIKVEKILKNAEKHEMRIDLDENKNELVFVDGFQMFCFDPDTIQDFKGYKTFTYKSIQENFIDNYSILDAKIDFNNIIMDDTRKLYKIEVVNNLLVNSTTNYYYIQKKFIDNLKQIKKLTFKYCNNNIIVYNNDKVVSLIVCYRY